MNRKLHAVLCGVAGALLGSMVLACANGPSDRACAPAGDLAKIEAAYIAEAVEACRGHTYDDCPALPALREKYARKREAWAECR